MRKQIHVSWQVALLFVLVWFLGATILLDIWPIVRSEGEWATITNTEYGFSVDYPTKWKARTYGEHGYKGRDEIKLFIYRSLQGFFAIRVEYHEMSNPTLQDAVAWGESQINKSNYVLIQEEEEVLNGHPVVRQRYSYSLGSAMYEKVYIARANDVVLIQLQADEAEFDSYLEDFDAIVASFRPLE